MGYFTYLEFLQKLVKNSYEQRDLNKFIEDLFIISQSYVRYRQHQISKLLESESLTTDDVAIEAIIPLFHKEKGKSTFVITEKIIGWRPKINTEDAALFFLDKIISNRVNQYISTLLRQSDPFFSKILDSVNYLIRKQSFVKKNHLGKIYILKIEEPIISEIIDSETFNNLPVSLFTDKRNVINKIFNYLKKETDFYPAIPCNDLVLRLKQINFSGFKTNDNSLERIEEIELDEIITIGLNNTIEKLKTSYLDNNKLNKKEFSIFKKALIDMTADLKNGGINPGLYKYLTEYQPHLCIEDYYNNYHNILEYLLKILKTNIAEELKEHNFLNSE